DPVEKDVIEGARCLLTSGSKTWDIVTDDFGDFWFKDLPIGVFNLVISAPGYEPKFFKDLKTSQCINLGDIALDKK
ncbi:MAG: carboxypeptidase regulatory-like domain-containing protein, partial [Peptococcaceae bacterium]|nr:carboxypeptidase regulatory-like domain-containing protein [Peptococcaceae bacterium]